MSELSRDVEAYAECGRALLEAMRQSEVGSGEEFYNLQKLSGFDELWVQVDIASQRPEIFRRMAHFVLTSLEHDSYMAQMARKTVDAWEEMSHQSLLLTQRQGRLSRMGVRVLWGDDPVLPSGDSLTMLRRMLALPDCNASLILSNFGVQLTKLSGALEALERPQNSSQLILAAHPAARVARQLGRFPVGTEHLLLVFLQSELKSRAGEVLHRLGVDRQRVLEMSESLPGEPQDEMSRITVRGAQGESAPSEERHHACGWALVNLILTEPMRSHFESVLQTPQFEATLRDRPEGDKMRFDNRYMALHGALQGHLEQQPLAHPELHHCLDEVFVTFGWMLDDGTIRVPRPPQSYLMEPW